MMNMYNNLKNYIMENEFCIHIFENQINIINYISIYEFNESSIIIKYKKGFIYIKGSNLSVCKLLNNEILINGNLDKLEFR